MKSRIALWTARAFAFGLVVFGLYTFNSPHAHASPFNDPHIPSYNNGWCPGGGLGVEGRAGWCDGEDYDDGTFWHQRGYEGVWGFKTSTACSIRTDNPLMLEHAPAGGCDGEA